MDTAATVNINIGRDFSVTPGPRFAWEGNFSGAEFRETILARRLREAIDCGLKLVVEMDGTAGYASSFLEEAFGGLVRNEGFSVEEVLETIFIVTETHPRLTERIRRYVTRAKETS